MILLGKDTEKDAIRRNLGKKAYRKLGGKRTEKKNCGGVLRGVGRMRTCTEVDFRMGARRNVGSNTF